MALLSCDVNSHRYRKSETLFRTVSLTISGSLCFSLVMAAATTRVERRPSVCWESERSCAISELINQFIRFVHKPYEAATTTPSSSRPTQRPAPEHPPRTSGLCVASAFAEGGSYTLRGNESNRKHLRVKVSLAWVFVVSLVLTLESSDPSM